MEGIPCTIDGGAVKNAPDQTILEQSSISLTTPEKTLLRAAKRRPSIPWTPPGAPKKHVVTLSRIRSVAKRLQPLLEEQQMDKSF